MVPAANADVLGELPEDVRAAVELLPVATAAEAITLALGPPTA